MKKNNPSSLLLREKHNGSRLNGDGVDSKQLLSALGAFKRGDFSVRLPEDWTGIGGKIADTFNDVIATNEKMARELGRISRLVGKEGRITQRATIGDVSNCWAGSIGSVNALIDDLVHPTSEMARVIGAVAKGDLSKAMETEIEGRPLEGAFLRTAKTVNTMVDQLGAFASEVTRVAREVGTEGKLGGQAKVKGVAGTWKDLTENVNLMAGNLTAQVRNIATVTTAVANGDLKKKITVDVKGEFLELKDTVNVMVDQLRSFASEVTRVAREVGSEGILGGQARVEGVSGTWKDLTDSVNFMARNLTGQVRNIAEVTTAVANGDLSKKITVDVKGEILELKKSENRRVGQLRSFAAEGTRVAREVGSEGKLGGQADVRGVAGTWKDLTDSVNFMASNLTTQVRNIAAVTTAVASGDLSKKITVDVKGEILELKNTVNTMVDQLNSFASEVTRVAREVGTEGKLGGQAVVQGVGGTWSDLTDSVNFMAGNLTNQVRGIVKVVTAVAKGDLKQKLLVEAKGEIAELADTINSMTDTLAIFADQVTTVAREVGVEGKLGGQANVPGAAGTWRDLTDNVNRLAANLTTQLRAIADVATAVTKGDLTRSIQVEARGEVAFVKDYVNVSSGLGESQPMNIVVLPILFEGKVKAVMELSSLDRFNSTHQAFLEQLTESIGIVLNTIEANTRTEDLLKQSQSLATELQKGQQELQKTNQELKENARSNLAKDQFLAMLSHELRTPLTPVIASALELEGEQALPENIHESLHMIRRNVELEARLIDDLLDLTRISKGKVQLNFEVVDAHSLLRNALEIYQSEIERKHLALRLDLAAQDVHLRADPARLQQIFWNLINNAVKFTPEEGQISISTSNNSDEQFHVEIADNGLGIEPESLPKIFDAFEQGTRTQLGGLGLGLAISKTR